MSVTHDQAVCLRHRGWSETSQTVVLLTERHGLVRGLAKGSRRERASFSGGFELLQLGEVGLILKAETDLALLTDWDLRNPYHALRTDHRAAVLAMAGAELTASAIGPNDPHPAVFEAINAMLGRMTGGSGDAAHHLAVYLAALLLETGQSPALVLPSGEEPSTESRGPGSDALAFDPVRGRLLTDLTGVVTATDPFDAKTRHDAVWPIRLQTVRYLTELADHGVPFPDRLVAGRGARFLTAWLAYRTGRQPQSLAAFLRVTRD